MGSQLTRTGDQKAERRRSALALSTRVEGKWWAYALAAGAGVLGIAPQAHAGIIYTSTDVYFTSGTVYLDLDNNGVNDFKLTAGIRRTFYNGFAGGLSAAGIGKSNGIAIGAAGALALNSGAVIGHKGKFAGVGEMVSICETYYGCFENQGKWRNVTDKYLGLVFDIDGLAHYGWAELSVSSSFTKGSIQVTLLGYAYNTVANQSIMAGETSSDTRSPSVPEPGTLGLLALGALGLGMWCRRREVAHGAQS